MLSDGTRTRFVILPYHDCVSPKPTNPDGLSSPCLRRAEKNPPWPGHHLRPSGPASGMRFTPGGWAGLAGQSLRPGGPLPPGHQLVPPAGGLSRPDIGCVRGKKNRPFAARRDSVYQPSTGRTAGPFVPFLTLVQLLNGEESPLVEIIVKIPAFCFLLSIKAFRPLEKYRDVSRKKPGPSWYTPC